MRPIAALLFAMATSCAGACVTAKPVPTPTPVNATCAGVCAHGDELGCIWATPTAKGVPCETVCSNATASGEDWRLGCLATIASCDERCP
jgi:hypothetical protein